MNKRNHPQKLFLLLLFLILFTHPSTSNVDNHSLSENNSLISKQCAEFCQKCETMHDDICFQCMTGYFITTGGKCQEYTMKCKSELEYLAEGKCEQNIRYLQNSDEEAVSVPSNDPGINSHGLIAFIAWGPLFELGTYFPKYFNHIKYYLVIHVFLHLSSYALTMWTGISNLIDQSNSGTLFNTDSLTESHFILGIIVIILSSLQIMGGFVTSVKLQSFKSNESFYSLAQGHKLNGILLSLITKYQLLSGTYLAEGTRLYGLMWGWVIFVFALRILITIIHKKMGQKHKFKPIANKPLSNKQMEIVTQLNNGIPSWVVKTNFPELKWASYGNHIIDMSSFLHPGGNFIIEEVWGREISRFLNGSYALETTLLTKHQHSSFAYNILNNMIIGKYDLKNNILIEQDSNQNDEAKELVLVSKSEYHPWTLVSVENLSPTISRFLFTSSEFKVSNFAKGLEWMGRHFEIFSPHYPTHKRLYTTVLCMTDDNINFRKIIIEFYHQIQQGATPKEHVVLAFPEPKDTLPLFIKKYNFKNGFTQFLYAINPQHDSRTNFCIKGPLGRGLELFEKPKGKHIILAVGTGILPLLDLLNYMMNTALWKFLKQRE